MAKHSHTQKDGTIWEWVTSKESKKALKEYEALVKENQNNK